MEPSIELRPGRFYLVLAPRNLGRPLMNSFAARLALSGTVRVLDGGNSFDALSVARQVRRRTADLEAALGRLSVARAFTCHQMVTLLSEQPASKKPVLVMDLLATFCDESVPVIERSRLLDQALVELRRLSRAAPLAASAVHLPQEGIDSRLPLGHPARLAVPLPAMLERLEQAADQVLRFVNPEEAVQGKLW